MLKLIIGLGNPGPKFSKNRHNIGFRILDEFVNLENLTWHEKKNFVESCQEDMKFIKPLTFMNNSGDVLKNFKNISAAEILVIHDELELPFGTIKTKVGGSHKGHNGLRSIIQAIGPDFHRLRFGVSRPENKESVPDYVLSNFTPDEEFLIPDLIMKSISIIKKQKEEI